MPDFEQISFTTDQISKRIWFVKKTDFDGCFALQKIFFGPFYHAKPQLLQLSAFSKTMIWKKMDKNQFVKEDFWKESDFETNFITTRQTLIQGFQNTSDFQSTLINSSFLETEILQLVKFWNMLLTHVRFWTEMLTTFLQRLRLLKEK